MRIFVMASFIALLLAPAWARDAPAWSTAVVSGGQTAASEPATIPPPPFMAPGESVEEFCALFADWQSRTDAPIVPGKAKTACIMAPKLSELWARQHYDGMKVR